MRHSVFIPNITYWRIYVSDNLVQAREYLGCHYFVVVMFVDEKTVLTSYILLDHNKRVVPSFVKVMAVVCCGSGNSPNVIRHQRDIPAKFVLCPNTMAQEKCPYKLSISSNATPIPLTNLFQGNAKHFCVEFTNEYAILKKYAR